jgi:hypothetical protein
MKRQKMVPPVMLFVKFYFFKIADMVLYPLKEIPVPDFNNMYDPTML